MTDMQFYCLPSCKGEIYYSPYELQEMRKCH